MFGSLITALRTLTALPVPGRDAPRLASSLPWFPLVGALLGALLLGVAAACEAVTSRGWPQGTACAVVAAGALLTRGLHLDGLADWADGFWGGHDREKVLRIMKDPVIGAFGAIALACLLLAKWAAVEVLAREGQVLWILPAMVVSRTIQVYLAVALPYARAEGGKAAAFVQDAGYRHLAGALILAAILLAAILGLQAGWALSLLGGLLAAVLFGAWCRRRIGGITGDLLGACSELTETLVLTLGAVAAARAAALF